MDKAPDAFRTISEVADVLETPAHVLRFWESRFPQIKPVKRAGGRRYYRPADVALLSGIRQLLHAEGMTIRGVQKILREQGVRHVAALGGADVSAIDLEAESTLRHEVEPAALPPVPQISTLPRRQGPSTPVDLPAEVQPLFVSPEAAPALTPAEEVSAVATGPDVPSRAEPSGDAETSASMFDAPRKPIAPDVPRQGEGGFIAFSNPRTSRPKLRTTGLDDPLQPPLPFDRNPAAEVPADTPETEVPEAPHVWVETDDNSPEAVVTLHPSTPWAEAAVPEDALVDSDAPEPPAVYDPIELEQGNRVQAAVSGGPEITVEPELAVTAAAPPDKSPASVEDFGPELRSDTGSTPVALAGLAAKLRKVGAVSPQARAELAELHSRLGLLHAQMAEAVRLRR